MEFEELFARRASHIKPGLERISKSYEFLRRPAHAIPAVLIGGTNGKGSTSAFIWSLLSANGLRAGLYTSPHLLEFSERFQISGDRVSDGDIKHAWEALQKDLPGELYEELSFFEIATLIAFRLFENRRIDFQVLEVGLGGRWDASNISDPLASVLVSVSLDHKEYLGDELLGILDEKLGIMRPGRPLFWGNQGEICAVPGYLERIEAKAKALGSPLYMRGREFAASADGITLQLPGLRPLQLPFEGVMRKLPPFLKDNLSLAAAFYAWHQAQQKEGSVFRSLRELWSDWCRGESQAPVSLVGRAQRILSPFEVGKRRLLIDVCHNPDGARAFVQSLRLSGFQGTLPAMVSILRDKDFDTILDVLRSVLHPVILFGIEHERTWDGRLLAERHRDLPFFPSLDAAWKAYPARDNEVWAVCGSVLAVGHMLKKMQVSPKDMSLARIIGGDWSFSDSSPDSSEG